MKDGKIGLFDSGIGGVNILKEIIKILPNEDYIYYSDSLNNPYGDKTDEEIIKICEDIVNKLIKMNCKAIVIACNTASAKASSYLRSKYNLPVFAIEPAYKMVHDYAFNDKTLVLATKGTIESEKFLQLYHKYDNNKTYLLPCSGLAELIENNEEAQIKAYLKEHLEKYQGVKNVVLGCTHYPLIKSYIKDILKDVTFFDGSLSLAKHVQKVLEDNNLQNESLTKGKIEFIDSSCNPTKEKRFWEILNR